MREKPMDGIQAFLGELDGPVRERLASLDAMRFSDRLRRKDPTLWKDEPEHRKVISSSLGWVDVVGKMEENLQGLADFASELRGAGFTHVVHMGMGGSSLAPLAFLETFGASGDGLSLTVLDTTDPATVLDVKKRVPLEKTLFIEASKSGSTVESRSFGEYFYKQLQEIKGEKAGDHFAVITDPGSMLMKLAQDRGYRRIFLNYSDIGGRYSALSYFGLVPAALMGMDVRKLLESARRMVDACAPEASAAENPGVYVGAVMGELALRGIDKVTFLAPAIIATFGMWLEQLIAESTGKEGVGILPIATEAEGDPSVYGNDRLFVYLRLEGEVEESLDRAVEALKKAGRPVVVIRMRDRYDMGAELYRWEGATAAAGAALGIDPFDQPNVQETKDFTNRLLQKVREEGRLPAENPDLVEGQLKIFGAQGASSLSDALARFFNVEDGGFLSILAYLKEDTATEQALQSLRLKVRDRLKLATTMGYGPRYLHSTGQLHKGGKNSGLFLELTADSGVDVDIPGQPYSFGALIRAQALGDLEALKKHGRRVLRVHLGSDAAAGLKTLEEALTLK